MKMHVRSVICEQGGEVGRALSAALNLAETLDSAWMKQVHKLQAELDELEAAKAGPYQHFFFTCPEPGRDSNGILEFFENCRLTQDFGRFRRGTTISLIMLNYVDRIVRIYEGHGMVEFKVELIQQG